MKLVPFFSLFLILLNGTAAESTPWKFYRHQSVPEQDASGKVDGENLSAFVRKWHAPGRIRFLRTLHLEANKRFRMDFTTEADASGSIYLTIQAKNGSMLLHTSWYIPKGRKKHSVPFLTPADCAPDAQILLQIGGLPGHLKISEVAFREEQNTKKEQEFREGSEWKTVAMNNLYVKPGSALDFSGGVPLPAGSFGRLIVNADGVPVFEKQPEKAVRFLGFNTVPADVYEVKDDAAFRKAVREFAQAARRQGYNLFRVNTLQDYLPRKPKQDRVVDPRWLDRFEYLLAELKKEGIYIQLVLTAQNPFFAPERHGEAHWYRNLYKMLFYLGEGPLMDAFQYTLSLMNRVNPHTGLAWKDDPAIVLVEFCNEQYAAFSYLAKFAHKFPKLFQSVEDEWNRRLTEKYGKRIPENIREGTPEGKPVPIPANQYGNSPAANEFTLFLQELTAANNRRCTELLRKAGYPGLVSQNNYRTLFSSAATQETMPVVDDHCYFAHPTRAVFTGAASSWMTSGSHVPAESSVAKAADYFRGLFTGRLYGKPFFVGEYNHCFWNPYLHEAGAVFGAYAAFQNFSGCAIFSAPVQQKPRPAQTMNNFLAGINPVMRANEAIAYFLFRRGDVAPARHSAILAIPRRMLKSGGGGRGAISSEQSKIALMTGFGVLFPELAGGNVLRKPDCILAPAGVAAIEDHDWFVSTVESASSRSSADSVAAELKRRGILPETNRSEPSKGIFESDTGELLMNTREKLFRAVTPRSETVSLPANRKVQLNHLAVSGSSIPATVSLHALDSQVLNRSRHMLLIYATATANSGMILSEDGATMTTQGVQPTLLRTGRLSFALDNVHAAEFALYALAMDGSRIQELPFNIRNGKCEVVINTAELRAGTVFFEFARKQK